MSDFNETYNKITNLYASLAIKSENTLSDHAQTSLNVNTARLNEAVELNKIKTVNSIENVKKKYSLSPDKNALIIGETSNIVSGGIIALNSDSVKINKFYINDINTYKEALAEEVDQQAQISISSLLAGFVGAELVALQNHAALLIDNFKIALANIANNAIVAGQTILNNILFKATGALNALLNLASIPPAATPQVKFAQIGENFFERVKGQSSTSKYIQTIVPDFRGAPKHNLGVLKSTPDSKIIVPKLKIDTNVVKQLGGNSKLPAIPKPDLTSLAGAAVEKITSTLPSLSDIPGIPAGLTSIPSFDSIMSMVPTLNLPTGLVTSLIPKDIKKKIEEPKPTSQKAEYGKVIVKESKAGFVEIQDETPGNERKVNLHPSGSYDQKLFNGDTTNKVTGKQILIIDKDWEITIGENHIVIVSGDEKVEVRKNKIESIKGDSDLHITGQKRTVVKSDVSCDYKENYMKKIGNQSNISIGGNSNKSVGGDDISNITGNQNETIGGNLMISTAGQVNIAAGGSVNIMAAGLVRIAGAKVMIG